ncbi:hypothetical protein [Thalassiella azotivora]
MSDPTPDGGRVGPFRVESVQRRTEAGEVLRAAGPDGLVHLVVRLAAGPAGDPACRGRFATVVQGGRVDAARVVAADLAGERPWAALAAEPAGPDPSTGPAEPPAGDAAGSGSDRTAAAPSARAAALLLSSVLPAGPDPVDGAPRGPRFAPYWSDGRWRPRPADTATMGPPTRRDRTVLWSLAAVLLAVLLMLLLLWWLLPAQDQGGAGPGPRPYPTRTLPFPSPEQPTPGPSGPSGDGRDEPTPGPTGPPGDDPGNRLLPGPTPSLPG